VENLRQDPDEDDSGLTEGSETEDVGFHSDEEDIGINSQTASEDSIHLRFLNAIYLLSFIFKFAL